MLDRIASFRNAGLVSQCLQRARDRFRASGELAMVQRWTALYEAGQRLAEIKTDIERKRNEYLQLAHDRELNTKAKNSDIARHEADVAEHNLRRDIAEYKRQHIERFIEGAQIPIPDPQPKLSPEQERRLKRIEIEDQMRELDRLQAEALKNARDDEDRIRTENMYEDKREELRQQLARYLV